MRTSHLTQQERWQQDDSDVDLWHGPNGLIVNTAALREREEYYRLDRILSPQRSPVYQADITTSRLCRSTNT
jgi:hypothetical protein